MGYFWVSLCIGLVRTQEHNLFTTISTEELSNYESAETILTLNQDRYEYFFQSDLSQTLWLISFDDLSVIRYNLYQCVFMVKRPVTLNQGWVVTIERPNQPLSQRP